MMGRCNRSDAGAEASTVASCATDGHLTSRRAYLPIGAASTVVTCHEPAREAVAAAVLGVPRDRWQERSCVPRSNFTQDSQRCACAHAFPVQPESVFAALDFSGVNAAPLVPSLPLTCRRARELCSRRYDPYLAEASAALRKIEEESAVFVRRRGVRRKWTSRRTGGKPAVGLYFTILTSVLLVCAACS
eukprot:scaffold788_cov231-Pinguiococcus_pyrenoidosus.AAC.15